MNFLPSKNFLILLIFSAVLGTGIFAFGNLVKKKTEFTQTGSFSEAKTGSISSIGETPLAEEADLISSSNFGGNYTEAASRELLTSLIAQGKTELSETDILESLNSVFADTKNYEPPEIYGEKNIARAPMSKESLRLYGNMFMDSVRKHGGANAASALNAFEQALQGEEGASKTILAIAEDYRRLESAMLELEVPETAVPDHLHFVNTLRGISNAVTDMSFATSDPFRGTRGFLVYVQSLDRAWEILANMAALFEREKISFGTKESGYVWKEFK